MKKQNYLLSIGMLGILISLTSCGGAKDSNDAYLFKEQNIAFTNLTKEAPIKGENLKVYFKDNSLIPYLGVKELVNAMDGWLTSSKVRASFDNQIARFEYDDHNVTYFMEIDAANETITQNCDTFFSFYDLSNEELYDLHHKDFGRTDVKGSNVDTITYDLKPYNFNIVMKDNDVILPYTVLNLIAMNANLSHIIYNGNQFYFYAGYLFDNEMYWNIQNKELNGTKVPTEIINQRFNEICFIMDYFYGIKEFFNGVTCKEYLNKYPFLLQRLNSSNANLYAAGLVEFLLKVLNDPHTMPGFKSFYDEVNNMNSVLMPFAYPNSVGERYVNVYETFTALDELYRSLFPRPQLGMSYGETGYIKFDSFTTDLISNLKDSNGNFKPEAYMSDSFLFMKKNLDIFAKDPNIKNVVIDLTCNTGGYVDIAYSSVGLLTNKDVIVPGKSGYTGHEFYRTFKVDSDLDNDFNDDDAYEQFNYYIMTSPVSFSSSTMFTSIAKDMGIATVIGQKSSGGMCGVSDANLIDGTTFSFSGNNIGPGMKTMPDGTKQFYSTEYGVDVDYEIEYENFYNLQYLDNFIKELKK